MSVGTPLSTIHARAAEQSRPVFYVCTAGGKQIPMNYRRELTILAIKQQIEHSEGCPAQFLVMIFKGRKLSDSDSLESIGVKANQKLRMLVGRPDLIQIFAKIEEKTRTLDVLPHNSVEDVKKLAVRTIRGDPDEFTITLKNRALQPTSRLCDIGIKALEEFELTRNNPQF